MIKKVLTIAGSDCSGGAGIQADIKTITVHKMYAMSVITAITAQNTTGVSGICECTPELVEKQLECVFEDIFPDAVKIGMVSNRKTIETIASSLEKYGAKNVVLDPVAVSTSGSKLLRDDAAETLARVLMPKARIVTPNIPEAQLFSGIRIKSEADMESAAKIIASRTGAAVLVKGGHSVCAATDILYDAGKIYRLEGKRIENPNTHGTGCTLSSAIACNIAAGMDLHGAVSEAKKYLTGAIAAGLDLGSGAGPLEHTYAI